MFCYEETEMKTLHNRHLNFWVFLLLLIFKLLAGVFFQKLFATIPNDVFNVMNLNC